jgi:hypothetical protein
MRCDVRATVKLVLAAVLVGGAIAGSAGSASADERNRLVNSQAVIDDSNPGPAATCMDPFINKVIHTRPFMNVCNGFYWQLWQMTDVFLPNNVVTYEWEPQFQCLAKSSDPDLAFQVVLVDCDPGDPAQQWQRTKGEIHEDPEDGFYRPWTNVNVASGECMELTGLTIFLAPCNGSERQLWALLGATADV